MDVLQPVVAWPAWSTFRDEVVDRVMHRRGSIGLGWLEQPLSDKSWTYGAAKVDKRLLLKIASVFCRNYA